MMFATTINAMIMTDVLKAWNIVQRRIDNGTLCRSDLRVTTTIYCEPRHAHPDRRRR